MGAVFSRVSSACCEDEAAAYKEGSSSPQEDREAMRPSQDASCSQAQASTSCDAGPGPLTPAAFSYLQKMIENMALADPPLWRHWMYVYDAGYQALNDKASLLQGQELSRDLEELLPQVQRAFVQALEAGEQRYGHEAFMEACSLVLGVMEYTFRKHLKFRVSALLTAAEEMFVDRRRQLCHEVLSAVIVKQSFFPGELRDKIVAMIQTTPAPDEDAEQAQA